MRDPSDYVTEYPSPTGRYLVRTVATEMRAFQWGDVPTVLDGDKTIAELKYRWSVEQVEWVSETRVAMKLRRFPNGSTCYAVVIDCAQRTFAVDGGEEQPLSEFGTFLNALADAYSRRMGR